MMRIHSEAERTLKLTVLAIFILLALLAYSTILTSFFLSDDFALIARAMEGKLHWESVSGKGLGFFRPLVQLSYVLDSSLWGTNPLGYHLINVLLHGLNSFLVFIIASRLIRNAGLAAATATIISIAAGLIFLLLPSHTEAVSWISGRSDVLSTFFCLLALTVYQAFRLQNYTRCLIVTYLFFSLAVLTKETAICLPAIILAFEAFSADNDKLKRLIPSAVVAILSLVGFFLMRHMVIGSFIAGYGTNAHLNFTPSLIYTALPKFIVRAFLPPLPERVAFIPFAALKWAALLILFVGAALIVRLLTYKGDAANPTPRHQRAFLLIIIASFFFALLPAISLGISLVDTRSERFVYLPSVFSSIFLAYISFIFIRQRKIWAAAMLCLLVFYSASLLRSNRNWREAGQLSQKLLEDFAGSPFRDNLTVINVPDNLRGAYVYRNGLPWALKYFQNSRRINEVKVVGGGQSLQTPYDEIRIIKDSNIFSISTLDNRAAFIARAVVPGCVKVLEQSVVALTFQLDDGCGQDMSIVVFSGGRLLDFATLR